MVLYNKLKRTLWQSFEAIYKKPVQSNIEWKEIESLIISLGAEISEGS